MLKALHISLIMTLSQSPSSLMEEMADDYHTGPKKCEVVSVDLDQGTGLCTIDVFEYLCRLEEGKSHEPRVHPSVDILMGYPRRKEPVRDKDVFCKRTIRI